MFFAVGKTGRMVRPEGFLLHRLRPLKGPTAGLHLLLSRAL